MFIKYAFCAKSSARLWGRDVAPGAHLANQTTRFLALISLPAPVPMFTLPFGLSLPYTQLGPMSGLWCLLFLLPRASQDWCLLSMQLKDISLPP